MLHLEMPSRSSNLSPFAGSQIESPEPIELLTAAAVREMLARPDPDSFLEWMRHEGPKGHPGVFADVPEPELWPSFATNLGIGLWNAMPFPHKGFRFDRLPKQKAKAPCRCRSGRKHGTCCAHLPPPQFPPALLWMAMIRELEDKDLAAASASLQIPADVLLELVRYWQGLEHHGQVLKLLEPVFRNLPEILADRPHRSRAEESLRTNLEQLLVLFVESLMEGGSPAKERRWRKRLLAKLPEELHRVVRVLGV